MCTCPETVGRFVVQLLAGIGAYSVLAAVVVAVWLWWLLREGQ